jgi:hypothetical protein
LTLLTAVASVPAAWSAPARADAATPAGHVVVLLKNQLAGLPPTPSTRGRRHTSALSGQQSLLARLPGRAPSGVRHFSVGNAFTADVTAAQSAALAADPAVAAVVPDVAVTPPARTPVSGGPGQAVCPSDPAKPLREPEALDLIHTPTGAGAPTGTGVRVGYIADGIDPANADFTRPDGSRVITDYKDFTGDGTGGTDTLGEGFGDVSGIAAQGTVVHDLHSYSADAPVGCTVRVTGVAPGASVVALKAISARSTLSAILQAIDYAVGTAHVDVLNESFGFYSFPDASAGRAVGLFNQQAVAGGVTVVAASGDAGVTSTIGSPAAEPGVISVGATTSLRLFAQLGINGTNGRWANGNIANFSSSGFTSAGGTIDLVAPGLAGWAACSRGYGGCRNAAGDPSDILEFAGTSMSAPLTSGAAALIIQAYRAHHHGASPGPRLVQRLLTSTAHDLGAPAQDQGAGLLDVTAATRAAAGAGGIVLSTGQLDLTGAAGARRGGTLTATNTGHTPVTVRPSLLRYAPQGHTERTLTAAAPVSIPVPAGAAQLTVRALAPDTFGGTYRLYAPDGTLVNIASGLLSSAETLSAVHPAAGTWRLTPPDGYTGPLTVRSDTTRAEPVRDARPPALVLPPGATRALTVRLTVPRQAGDVAYALRLGRATLPVIVRTLVTGSFAGVLETGAGRVAAPVQTHTYAFDVPAGKPALTVTTTLAPVSGGQPDEIAGLLIAPGGEALSIARNSETGDTAAGLLQSVPRPVPGRWLYILLTQNLPQTLTESYSGTVRFDPPVRIRSGLPHGTLPAGRPSQGTVQVTNPGPVPLAVGVDARTPETTTMPLTPLMPAVTGDGSTFLPAPATVPLPGGHSVDYLVPAGATGVAVTSTGTEHNQVLLVSPANRVQGVGGTRGDVSTASVNRPGPGLWTASPQVVGPFGATGAPAGTATLAATVRAPGFDRTVTSSTADDPYLIGVDATAPAAEHYVTVPPRSTVTVPVSITPTAARGTVIHGTLDLVTPVEYADDLSILVGGVVTTSGDILAGVPYSYRVG